ncbi:hypothetical protein K491DRAFT_232207 [Lophiostoma macrostomum CBS 122681]|uniref:Uncharacterized protein n=1 Tax=Lophiostoma macrostomum CBS 122681 TaxID=1314788 RepID=A0A6A6SQS9_9PLEO|nr:hypothetical protein K491DRAFT_232207 [Lophiostoma macrostomum CBS 122681]
MSAVETAKRPMGYMSDSENSTSSRSGDGQATGGRKVTSTTATTSTPSPSGAVPSSSHLNRPAGSLLKGATDDKGNLKDAALLLGIKLDLEAEIHLTARIRGDITIGLY